MRLSLCIATYNEEKFIHYPLDSAYDLVDEVVIVDGGSTDGTIKKAKSYGEKVRVISTDNPAMFHINKQKAIEAAHGEWILQLDADEALPPELKDEIFRVTRYKLHVTQVAFNVPRKNYFLGRFLMKGGVYPDYTIRLYKNGVAHFPCQSVHENVEVNGKIGYLKAPILHYADPTFSRYLKRWNRYNSLEAQRLFKKLKIENSLKIILFFDYIFIKPLTWFFNTYFRHLGFLDGWQGFVFHFMSSIRFWAIYVKFIVKSRELRVKSLVKS